MTMDVISSGGDKIGSYLDPSNKPSKKDVPFFIFEWIDSSNKVKTKILNGR
jgi:hypothetical protein